MERRERSVKGILSCPFYNSRNLNEFIALGTRVAGSFLILLLGFILSHFLLWGG